jgi:hypothetical protein
MEGGNGSGSNSRASIDRIIFEQLMGEQGAVAQAAPYD